MIQGNCGNETLAYIILEVISLVADLGIVILPIRFILTLQMTVKRRLGFITSFSLGVVWVLIHRLLGLSDEG